MTPKFTNEYYVVVWFPSLGIFSEGLRLLRGPLRAAHRKGLLREP